MGIIQQASGTFSGNGTFTPTLPAASSAANRVAVIVAGNTVVSTPSGWTLRTSQVNLMGHYLWDRAGGAAAYNFSANGQLTWYIAEIEAGAFDNALSTNNSASGINYSTPNLTPTAGTRVMLASIGSTFAGTVRTVSGWTGSFVEQADLCQPTVDYPMQGVADLDLTADGSTAHSTTATYSSNSVGRTAIISSYVTSSGAPQPNSGTGSTGVTWSTSAAGHKLAHAAASIGLVWTVAASGHAPVVAEHHGAASIGASWSTAAAGHAPTIAEHHGSSGLDLTWSTDAAGSADHAGSASTGVAWTPAVNGHTEHRGSADTTATWATTATGHSDHAGTASADATWTTDATGHTQRAGSSDLGLTWTTSAAGRAPTVGVRSGTGSITLDWTSAATGTTTRHGTSAVGATWNTAATGHAPAVGLRHGTAAVTVQWVTASAGQRESRATAATVIDWTPAASGSTSRTGTAGTGVTWTLAAHGRNSTGRDITVIAALQPSPWAAAIAGSTWAATVNPSTWSVTIVDSTVTRRADSLEYVKFTLAADHDISADTVQLSIDSGTTWTPATKLDDGSYAVLAGPGGDLAWPSVGQNYRVLVRVTDNPEIPVLDAGTIYVGG